MAKFEVECHNCESTQYTISMDDVTLGITFKCASCHELNSRKNNNYLKRARSFG